MTAPQLSRTALDPVAAAWLAGGAPRAVDTVLVSRLEHHRIRVIDGTVVDRGLDRGDPLDGALLDALGARRRRDLETVRWRLLRDSRLERVRQDLATDGLVAERTRWGTRATPEHPAPTATGRRLLRELRAAERRSGTWEVALHGRKGITDLSLREALERCARPPVPRAPRRIWSWDAEPRHQAQYLAGGASMGAVGGWSGGGVDCGGGFGGGGDGGGC